MIGRRLAMLMLGVGSLGKGPIGCGGEGAPTATPGEDGFDRHRQWFRSIAELAGPDLNWEPSFS
jgi:hypothetical protein